MAPKSYPSKLQYILSFQWWVRIIPIKIIFFQLVAPSPVPQLGITPTTQACALTGNQTGDLLLCGAMPNPLSHTGQGSLPVLTAFPIPAHMRSVLWSELEIQACLNFPYKSHKMLSVGF